LSGEVARLHVRIGAKLDDFNRGMQSVSSKLQSTGQRVSRAGAGLTKGITAPLVAAGGAAIGMANKYASMGDDIAKTAQKVGIGTDALQELRYAGEQTGVESDQLDRALGRLNQRMGRAAAGNDNYAEALANLGVDMDRVKEGTIETDEAFMQAIETLHGMEDASEQAAMAGELFGTRLGRELLPMIQSGNIEVAELREKLHELGGVMDEDAVKAAEDYRDNMNDLRKSFAGVGMELANKFIPIISEQLIPAIQDHVIPVIQRLADTIGRAIDWFMDLPSPVQKAAGALAGLAVAIGPVLMVAGKLMSIIGAVIGVLSAKVLIVGAVIGALVAFGTYLYNLVQQNEQFRERVSQVWEKLKEFMIGIWETLSGALGEVWEALKKTAQVVVDYIGALWERHGENILNILTAVWNQIEATITTVITVISQVIQAVLAVIRGDWEAAWEHMAQAGKAIWGYIKTTARNIFNILANVLSVIWRSIRDNAVNLWEAIRDAVARRAEALRDSIIETVERAVEFIRNLPGKAVEWGRGIIQGLIDGIRGLGSNLLNAITGVVGDAVDAAKNFLGLSSPSKVFTGIGENVGIGMEQGILKTVDRVRGAISEITAPDVDLTTRAVPSGLGADARKNRTVEALLRQIVKAVQDQDSTIQIEVPEQPGTYQARFSKKFKHRGLEGALR